MKNSQIIKFLNTVVGSDIWNLKGKKAFTYCIVFIFGFTLAASAPMAQSPFFVPEAEALMKSKGVGTSKYGSATDICGLQLCSVITGGKAAFNKMMKNYLTPLGPVEKPVPVRGDVLDDILDWSNTIGNASLKAQGKPTASDFFNMGDAFRSGDFGDVESTPMRGGGFDEVAEVVLNTDVEDYHVEDLASDSYKENIESIIEDETTKAANVLKKEISELESQISAKSGLDQQLKDLQVQIAAQEELVSKRDALLDLLRTQDGLNEKIKQLQDQIEDADAINRQIAEIKGVNAELRSNTDSLDEEFATVKTQVDDAIAKIEEFTKAEDEKVKQLQTKVEQAVSEKKEIQTQAIDLQKQVGEIQQIISEKSTVLVGKQAEKEQKDREAAEEKRKAEIEKRKQYYTELAKKRAEAAKKHKEQIIENRKIQFENRKCHYFPYKGYWGGWTHTSFAQWLPNDEGGRDFTCIHRLAANQQVCELPYKFGGNDWKFEFVEGKPWHLACQKVLYTKNPVAPMRSADFSETTDVVADLQNKVTELQATLATLATTEKAITTLKESVIDIAPIEAEVKSLATKVVKTEDLEEKITSLTAQIQVQEKLKAEIATLNEETGTLKELIAGKEEILGKWKEDLASIPEKQKQAEALTKENLDAVQKELDEANAGKTEAESRVTELKAEIEKLNKESTDLDTQIEQITKLLEQN